MVEYCITCERDREIRLDETDEQYCTVCGCVIVEDDNDDEEN